MSESYVGQIITVGFDFAPEGYLPCNGQLLAISDYFELYSVLGTTYGGDGKTTFGLPNLNGSVGINQGTGPGLPPYALGQQGGSENVTLAPPQMPAHTHQLMASSLPGSTVTPLSSTALAASGQTVVSTFGTVYPDTELASAAISTTGGAAHENRQPFLAITYIIAYTGIFPSEN